VAGHDLSAEETSTQIEVVFTDALEAEGLLGARSNAASNDSTSAPMTSAGRSC
jgi:hypothetical protein